VFVQAPILAEKATAFTRWTFRRRVGFWRAFAMVLALVVAITALDVSANPS